jgi:hypothetical protein
VSSNVSVDNSPDKSPVYGSSGFSIPKVEKVGMGRRLTAKLEILMAPQLIVPAEHSDDSIDYGMTRYTDLEIANHLIMIEGFPNLFLLLLWRQNLRSYLSL